MASSAQFAGTPFIANTPSTFPPESLLTRARSPALCMKFRFQLKRHLARVAFPTRIASTAPSWEVKFDDTEKEKNTSDDKAPISQVKSRKNLGKYLHISYDMTDFLKI